MITEERQGRLVPEDEIDENHPVLALFGRPIITAEEAAQDGVDLFAARVAAFDTAMQSSTDHFELKSDLVEHIPTTMS